MKSVSVANFASVNASLVQLFKYKEIAVDLKEKNRDLLLFRIEYGLVFA
jgi:hypothetical protein